MSTKMALENDDPVALIKHYQKSLEKYSQNLDTKKLVYYLGKLNRMPITVKHLKDTGIGRTVNGLRKLDNEASEASKILVLKWKEMVMKEDSAAASESEKEEQENAEDEEEEEEEVEEEGGGGGRELEEEEEYSSHQESDKKTKESCSSRHREKEKDKEHESKKSKHSSKHDRDVSKKKEKRKAESDDDEGDGSVLKKSRKSSNKHHDSEEDSDVKHKKHNSKESRSKYQTESDTDIESDHKNRKDKTEKLHSSKSKVDKISKHKVHSEKKKLETTEDSESEVEVKKQKLHEKKKDKDKKETTEDSDSEVEVKKQKLHEKKKDKDKKKEKHKSKDYEKKSHEKHKSDHTSKTSDEKKKHSESSSSSSKSKDHSSHKKSSKDKEKKEEKKSSKRDRSETSEKVDTSHRKKKIRSKELENGIDCGSGASFAEALGMLTPSSSKSSTKKKISSSSSKPVSKESSPNTSKTSAKTVLPPLLQEPLPLQENKFEQNELNISSLLPAITPNYRPLGIISEPVTRTNSRVFSDEALAKVMSSKNQRTKVYSGNKSTWNKVPSLFEICIRILQDNIDALEYTGGVPYGILKPVLEKATPDQLFMLEHHNPYLIEDTDELWYFHCQKEFKTKQREELESWREMYMRCLDEREARLKALTANIKMSQDKSTPVRQTKLAYIDNYVKPPRQIAKKQAKNGIIIDKTPSVTPTARLNAIAASASAGQVHVPNPGARAAEQRSSSSSSSSVKPKKAPLMQKTLALIKSRFRR